MSNRRLSYGFTLIELLVVISIIALLVSILLPTLTAARYQAKLSQCGSNLKQIGIMAHAYAADSNGVFPERDPAAANITYHEPMSLRANSTGSSYDHRVQIKPYLSSIAAVMNDPLQPEYVPEMDWSIGKPFGAAGGALVRFVYGGYDLWYNFPMIADTTGYAGDKLERADDIAMEHNGVQFDTIGADHEAHYTAGWSNFSHPSKEFGSTPQVGHGGSPTAPAYALWYIYRPDVPPAPERNFLRIDGSVHRVGGDDRDKRLVRVPFNPRIPDSTTWTHLPARGQ